MNPHRDYPVKTKRLVIGQGTICQGCCCGNPERGLAERPQNQCCLRNLHVRQLSTISNPYGVFISATLLGPCPSRQPASKGIYFLDWHVWCQLGTLVSPGKSNSSVLPLRGNTRHRIGDFLM